MKCNQAQKRILLAQSGELAGWFRRRLDRHLEHCPACRAYRLGLDRITEQVRESSPTEPLPAWQLDPILRAAQRRLNRGQRRNYLPSREPFLVMWRPALLYASLGILLLTALLLIARPVMRADRAAVSTPTPANIRTPDLQAAVTETETEDRLDNDLEMLNEELTRLPPDWSGSSTAKNEDDLDAIARELIQLEASTI